MFKRASLFAAALLCQAVSLALQAGSTPPAQADINRRVEALLSQMTIEEKFGQLQQLSGEGSKATAEEMDLAR